MTGTAMPSYDAAPGDVCTRLSGSSSGRAPQAAPPPPPLPLERPAQPSSAERAESSAAAASGSATSPGEPSSRPESANPNSSNQPVAKPAIVIKPKQSIVQVRPRSAGVAKAKKKKDAAEAASFYLKEMERYQRLACDSKGGGRPMVK